MNGKEKMAAYCLLALHGYKRSEIEEIMKKVEVDLRAAKESSE
ncbi:hypothetical protein [Bacillus phage BM-P1]|mgnify:CR=1 FL=1|nr:hypothetical protein BSP12_126 [Bacillus phage BSP12]UJJ74671.1 hypothetical protein [Bacillus phage BM-P1]